MIIRKKAEHSSRISSHKRLSNPRKCDVAIVFDNRFCVFDYGQRIKTLVDWWDSHFTRASNRSTCIDKAWMTFIFPQTIELQQIFIVQIWCNRSHFVCCLFVSKQQRQVIWPYSLCWVIENWEECCKKKSGSRRINKVETKDISHTIAAARWTYIHIIGIRTTSSSSSLTRTRRTGEKNK